MAVLILTAIILYLLLLSTVIVYLLKMNKIGDTDKKLMLTYNSLGAIVLEQIIALVVIIAFYALKLNDIDIEVPEYAAVLSMIMQIIGFILTGYFWFSYRRKHFLEYVRRGKVEKKARGLNNIITVGIGVSAMNFVFNLMFAGAMNYLASI